MTSSAMYVGRVGALAVALGVGMAVATGQGVAWAGEDGGTDGGGETNSVGADGSTPSTGTGGDVSTEPPAKTVDEEPSAPPSTPPGGMDTAPSGPTSDIAAPPRQAPSPTQQTITIGPDVVVRSSGGALTSGDTRPPAEERETSTPPSPDNPPTPPAGNPETSSRTSNAVNSFTPTLVVKSPVVETFSPQLSPTAVQRKAAPTPASTTLSTTTVVTDPLDTQLTTTARQSTFSARVSAPVPAQVNPVTTFLAVPTAIISTVTSVLTAVLTPFVAPAAPGSPPNPPLLWGILEAVRRNFFNQTPKIRYTTTPETTGDITISLNKTDADGDTLSYTATGGAKGDVVLNPDGHSFTYTPHDGATGTDTVTITASDGSGHIHGIPGLLNALTFGRFGSTGHTATTTVEVELNTAPTLTVSPGTPDPSDGTVTVTVLTTDADGDAPEFSITTPPGGSVGTPTLVDPATGEYEVVYTPSEAARIAAAATAGDDTETFTVTVTDGRGGAATRDVTVKVTPADIASDPELAVTATQAAVTSEFDEWTTAQAAMEATIQSIDPTLSPSQVTEASLKAQAVITVGLAQSGIRIQDPNAGPTPQLRAEARTVLEDTLGGPLTDKQVQDLTADAMKVAKAGHDLEQPLAVSADAAALAAWNAAGDGKPVFSRIEYTVAADMSVIGRVYFVDPDNDPAQPLFIDDDLEEATFFDPAGSGNFIMDTPNFNNPVIPRFVTVDVTATDSDGNVVTQTITIDRTPPLPPSLSKSAPSATYTWGEIASATGSISNGAAGIISASYESDAARLEAAARYNDARGNEDDFVQELQELTDAVQTTLLNIIATNQTTNSLQQVGRNMV